MRTLTKLLALFTSLILSQLQAEKCYPTSFGHTKAALACFWEDCSRTTAPDEIKQIKRGVYVEFVGLSTNDGNASWIGVDLDKRELFQINRFAGPRLKKAPAVATTEYHFVRETKADKFHWIDVIRKRTLPTDALNEIVCSANLLWVAKPLQSSFSYHIFNELRLVDGAVNKGIGGMGSLPQNAQAFEALLQSYREPDWKDY
jgi:hypothetical protein